MDCNKFVVMSLGRSGSSAIQDTLRRLTGVEPHTWHRSRSSDQSGLISPGDEILGSGDKADMDAFAGAKCQNRSAILYTVKNFFHRYCEGSNAASFKLKPYFEMMPGKNASLGITEPWQELFRWMKSAHVRVIWSSRNPLDVIMSSAKHAMSHVSAHCKDHACVAKAEEADSHVTLDVESTMVHLRKEYDGKRDTQIRVTLDRIQIPYFKATYEDFFCGPHASRLKAWKSAVRFTNPNLNESYVDKLTMKTVTNDEGGILATHTSTQADGAANFAEIEAAIRKDGRFIQYLRDCDSQ